MKEESFSAVASCSPLVNTEDTGRVRRLFKSTTLPPTKWILTEYAGIPETQTHTNKTNAYQAGAISSEELL